MLLPAEIDSGKQNEIQEFKRQLERKLIFVWRPEDNKFFEETRLLRGTQKRIGKIGRVAIKNESTSETVFGVHVSLVNYLTPEKSDPVSIDRRLVGISADDTITDLHASREETYEVFRIYEGKPTLRLAPYDEREVPRTLPQGTYKLKITASATGMSRQDQYYFLRFDNYENIEFRPWAESDALTQGE